MNQKELKWKFNSFTHESISSNSETQRMTLQFPHLAYMSHLFFFKSNLNIKFK